MLLSELIAPLSEKYFHPEADTDISAVAYDSRNVKPGALFICIRGERFDGNTFIGDAINRGAVAVMTDSRSRTEALRSKIAVVEVPDARAALSVIANQFYGHPSHRMKLVGVTGTKGKTTTTYLIEGILEASGMPTGVIGTLGARLRGANVHQDRTTPESVDLQKLLACMVDKGIMAAAMEVSSHALVKGRTEGCEYDVGVFTNLTHDHLDFHHTFEEYLKAKMILFDRYPTMSAKEFTGVINVDDPRGQAVCDVTKGRVITFGIRNQADITASEIEAGANGVRFHVNTPSGAFYVNLRLAGAFNVYNALGAVGAAVAMGIEPEEIKNGLELVKNVPGRFESVDCGQDFGVIVDFAHTPDSLQNVLHSARELTKGRLITVFGCGGDRDRAKRPVMGRMGAEIADWCIVTSDNPRTEDPDSIIKEILSGIGEHAGRVESIVDRRTAIEHALNVARAGDIIVIAGKGHETYQIFKERTIHFDDREVVREVLGQAHD
jgi:UDP-N-acetylmuramyl-tripeptide synthetase